MPSELLRLNLRKAIRKRVKRKPYRFQRKGIRFIEKTGGRTLVCDDMGLGKTYQTEAWCAVHPELRPVVVLCPATIKFNWQREWKLNAGLSSYVCDGRLTTKEENARALHKAIKRVTRTKRFSPYQKRRALLALRKRYSKKWRETVKKLRAIRKERILIINYDIMESWEPFLIELKPKVLIIDECHYIQNINAKRTKSVTRLSKGIPHVLALSGTPISGRPAQFYPVLRILRPDKFNSFTKFAMKYCDMKKNDFTGEWDYSGSSNSKGLHKRIKPFMIRRMKHKVLKDLPRKTRTVIPLEISNRKEYAKAEADFLKWLLKRKGVEAWMRARRAEIIVRMNGLKLLAAKGKLKIAEKWISDFLTDSDQKLIVFGIHKVILKRLKKRFPEAMVIDGSVSAKPVRRVDSKGREYETSKRQEIIDKFQTSPKHRLLIGNIKAMGVGSNLTAASNVLFLEIGWTPGEHEQAEDRALRIGQEASSVNCYYLVGRETIEEHILKIIHRKDVVINQILNGKDGAVVKLLDIYLKKAG